MNQAEDQEVRPRRNPLLWPLRFLLHWIIKTIVIIFIGISFVLRPKPIRYGVVAILAVGVIAWGLAGPALTGRGLALAGSAPPQTAAVSSAGSSNMASTSADQSVPQSPVVQDYLKAQANYDANGMWNNISDALKQQLASSNTTVSQLQQELNSAKQSGRRYTSATYFGGMEIDTGTYAYFYVLTEEDPSGTTHVPYIYVVGQDGKIDSIQ